MSFANIESGESQGLDDRLREQGASLRSQITRNPTCHAPECVNRHLTRPGIHLFTKASCDICERDLGETPPPPMVYEHDERAKTMEEATRGGVDIKKKYPTVFFVKEGEDGNLYTSEYNGTRDSDIMFEEYRRAKIR